jgi:hypothetical protein
MARKPNYSFEKRQKDLARIKKKEDKLQKKALKKDAQGEDLPQGEPLDEEGAGEGQPGNP